MGRVTLKELDKHLKFDHNTKLYMHKPEIQHREWDAKHFLGYK